MADTTHNLKIKATLDASGIQAELDRLNQQNRGGDSGGGQGARSTARLLNKLDQTLSRLNRTLEQLARNTQINGNGPHYRNQQVPLAMPSVSPRQAGAGMLGGPTLDSLAGLRMTTRLLPDRIIREVMSHLTDEEWALTLLQGVSPRTLNRSERRRLSNMLGQDVPAPSIRQRIRASISDAVAEARWQEFQATGGAQQQAPGYKITSVPVDRRNVPPNTIISENALKFEPVNDTPPPPESPRRKGLKWLGRGSVAYLATHQLDQWGELYPETGGRGFSATVGIAKQAGLGMMVGGPWGAALMAGTQAVYEFAKALKQAETEMKARQETKWAEGRRVQTAFAQYEAEKLDLPLAKTLMDAAEKRLGAQRDYLRPRTLQELQDLTEQRATPENMELIEKTKKYLQVLDENIKADEQLVRTVQERIDAEREERASWKRQENANVRAYRRERERYDEHMYQQRLAYSEQNTANVMAYRAEQKRHDEHVYQQSLSYSEQNTANVQAYREAQKRYNDFMEHTARTNEGRWARTSTERILGQIRTGTFSGDLTQDIPGRGLWSFLPDYQVPGMYAQYGLTRKGVQQSSTWYRLARERRQEILQLQTQMDTSDNPKEIEKLGHRLGMAQQQFSSFMQIAQALRQIGQPIRRVDLQGMTSLAGRGGWMGEQYRQPEYMQTLDKMYETLKNIDDNTREAEKNVWR